MIFYSDTSDEVLSKLPREELQESLNHYERVLCRILERNGGEMTWYELRDAAALCKRRHPNLMVKAYVLSHRIGQKGGVATAYIHSDMPFLDGSFE